MKHKDLDCRGLPCPQPVMQCKHCVDSESPQSLAVAVDNEAARENVTRFLTSQGFVLSHEALSSGSWTVKAARQGQVLADAKPSRQSAPQKTTATEEPPKILVFLAAARIGTGDDSLGQKLMASFLATLPELGSQLWRMILVNEAVTLAVENSPALDSLKKLEAEGVSILVCGTCLTHFNLLEKKVVGQTTNMLDVVTSLQLADKVIRP